MNWYKKATRMFQTLGLDKKLTQAFERHYYKWLRNQNSNYLQKKFEKQKRIQIGSANLGNSLDPIFEKHGEPQGLGGYIPRRVNFFVVYPSEQQEKAVFFVSNNYDFNIGIASKDINNVKFGYEFERSIAHELQHFLRSLYENKPAASHSYLKDRKAIDYYSDPWEIQAFALKFAKDAIELIESTYMVRLESGNPEMNNIILEKLMRLKPELVSLATKEAKQYFKRLEDGGIPVADKLKKQYYVSTISNFNLLFDEMIQKYQKEST